MSLPDAFSATEVTLRGNGRWVRLEDYARTVGALRAQLEAAQTSLDRLTGMKFSDRMHAALVARAEAAEANAAAPAPVAGEAVAKLVEDLWDESKRFTGFYAGDVRAIADRLRAALAQDRASQASAAGVPDGWRLVPIEPTGRMIDAGILAYDGKCERSYAAMLAAAPTPAAERKVQ